MNKPIIVTKKEFIEYIHSKDPSTPVNMHESNSDDECGCVMAQYAKDLDFENFSCGFTGWCMSISPRMRFETPCCIDNFTHNTPWGEIKTFGDLQQLNPL